MWCMNKVKLACFKVLRIRSQFVGFVFVDIICDVRIKWSWHVSKYLKSEVNLSLCMFSRSKIPQDSASSHTLPCLNCWVEVILVARVGIGRQMFTDLDSIGFGSFGRFWSQKDNVKKVSIHLKRANVVITPSEGGRCNIVCYGIFRYPFPFVIIQMLVFSQIVVLVGLVDTWMVLLHIGNDNESFWFVL
jgi:hypothetical protein